MLDGLQPFHLGICEIGKQGVAVVQSRCYESLYYAPCCICCDITADRRQPVEPAYSPLVAEKSGGTIDRVTGDSPYNGAHCSGASL